MTPVPTTHFLLHRELRHSRIGPGFAVGGVRGSHLLPACELGLESLYKTLINPPFSRKPPIVSRSLGKTCVYVAEIPGRFPGFAGPFTYRDDQRVPFIGLPCRTRLPSLEAERTYATIAGAHEATHVFNYTDRPHWNPDSDPWAWFDEGTAVFMERYVFPKYPNYLEYSLDWCDRPERPLDDFNSRYQTEMFVRYLVTRWGPEFLSEVWMNSKPIETPLQAINRLLKERNVSDADRGRGFSTYCLHSYFTADANSYCHAPDVHDRHCERALMKSFELSNGDRQPVDGAVEHLACHYYRFYVASGVRAIRADLATGRGPRVEATIAAADAKMHRGATGRSNAAAPVSVPAHGADHFVLVVSNSALYGGAEPYSIQVSAV